MHRHPVAASFALVLSAFALPSEGRAGEDLREAAVYEAVFRQQLGFWLDPSERARHTVICLAIDPGGAPQSVSKAYLARFKAERAARRGAECEARPEGAMETSTLLPAIIVTAGPIEWVAADEAWVQVSHFRSRLQSGTTTYRVVQDDGSWVSLGPIFRQAPA